MRGIRIVMAKKLILVVGVKILKEAEKRKTIVLPIAMKTPIVMTAKLLRSLNLGLCLWHRLI
jgi:hypothetical protein